MRVSNKGRRSFSHQKALLVLAFLLLAPVTTVLATDFNQSFDINFSNEASLPVQTYATVGITGDTSAGTVWFSVDALTPPFTAGTNFGIQTFGFNSSLTLAEAQFDLPSSWSLKTDQNLSMFGTFDYVLKGTGSSRQDPLDFHITGLQATDVELANFSLVNQDGYNFEVHIADFSDVSGGNNPEFTSAQFAGKGNGEIPELPTHVLLLIVGAGSILILTKNVLKSKK